jgi:hypothetical protein
MRLHTLMVVVLCVAVLAVASQPLGHLYVKSHIEDSTLSDLSMSKFRIHPISGRISVEQAKLTARKSRISPTLATEHLTSPIEVKQIWSQGSLPAFLHKRLALPIVVMDGVSIKLSRSDLVHVPTLTTEMRVGLSVSNTASLSSQSLKAFDQDLASNETAIRTSQTALQAMEQHVASIEEQIHRTNNPLRGREAAVEARQSLLALESSANDLGARIDSLAEKYRASVEAARKAFKDEQLLATGVLPSLPANEADFENAARSFIESLMKSTFSDTRPHLGLAVRLLEEANLSTVPRTQRGVDFSFADAPQPNLLCSSVRFRGAASYENQSVPFSGFVINFGSTGFEEHERPAYEVKFESNEEQSLPGVEIQATLSPDRQGFLLSGKTMSDRPFLTTVVNGDFEADIDLESPSLSFKWLMHQREWTIDMMLDCSQAKISLNDGTNQSLANKSSARQSIECFHATKDTTFIQASVRGTVVDGQFVQRAMDMKCPASMPIAKSLQEVYEKRLNKHRKEQLEVAGAAWEIMVSKRSQEFEIETQAVDQQLVKLQSRLASCKQEVLAIIDPASDVRFSRAPAESSIR